MDASQVAPFDGKQKLPSWFKVTLPTGDNLKTYTRLKSLHKGLGLHTVCEEASCPNMSECWGRGTATFMLMGSVCTRGCRYCDVDGGKPQLLDPHEPENVAHAIKRLGLRYAVITSVTRDDLADGGAAHFAATVQWCKRMTPKTTIELLIPDFWAGEKELGMVIASGPRVIGHNIESVQRVYDTIRPKGGYRLALKVLATVKRLAPAMLTKSGIMVGHGERMDEIVQTLKDLRSVGCDLVSVGQYLRPSQKHVGVQKFYTPQEFKAIRERGMELGFKNCVTGPLVRSSYRAEQHLQS